MSLPINLDSLANFPSLSCNQFNSEISLQNMGGFYKIRDSIIGRSFNFGERVTTVAAQDYKAADKFSDITYSGIYNGESNINRLNEFNKGLSNYKHSVCISVLSMNCFSCLGVIC